jgi:lysophospholipase L1-like esterase
MKKLIAIQTALTLLLALLLAGCSLDAPSDPTGNVNDPGPADASTPYVAIGNSLTAGFMDSGLIENGQANSYAMIVATQMGLNMDTFTQPWIGFPGIGTTDVGAGNTAGVLHFNGTTVVPVAITPADQVPGLLKAVAQPTQYHNLGVPGAFSFDLLNAYSAASSHGVNLGSPNSFFEFINRAGPLVGLFKNIEVPAAPPAPGYWTGSQFYQVIAKGPALVTAWIGGNDFLFGATSGEPIGHPAITPPGEITAPVPGTYAYNYSAFLGSLAAGLNGRNGFPTPIVGATLPLVRNIAYFLDRGTFETIFGQLQLTYEEPDAEYILFVDFIGSDLPTTPQGMLPANMTLDAAEVQYLDDDVIGKYNEAIVGTMGMVTGNPGAPIEQLPIVDFNQAMDDLRAGNPGATWHFLLHRITNPTGTIEDWAAATYFSLDGVHPNNKGYAFTANAFIAKINEVTGSSWAEVPVDAFIWDPTYGQDVKVSSGMPTISPEALEAMKRTF